ELIDTAHHIAADENIVESGYRLLFNTNADAGQTIFHVHLHLLGGEDLGGLTGGPIRGCRASTHRCAVRGPAVDEVSCVLPSESGSPMGSDRRSIGFRSLRQRPGMPAEIRGIPETVLDQRRGAESRARSHVAGIAAGGAAAQSGEQARTVSAQSKVTIPDE